MLPRHKKALSDIKSAEKKLKDTQTKFRKTREALQKVRKEVAAAKARLAAAEELLESWAGDGNGAWRESDSLSCRRSSAPSRSSSNKKQQPRSAPRRVRVGSLKCRISNSCRTNPLAIAPNGSNHGNDCSCRLPNIAPDWTESRKRWGRDFNQWRSHAKHGILKRVSCGYQTSQRET